MGLATYDPRMMELLYFLTKNQKYMNSVEISHSFSSGGEKFSDRTIRRWFDHLQEKCLDYFPYVRHESFGLVSTFLILKNLKNENLIQILPHINYISQGMGFEKTDDLYVMQYFVPVENLGRFEGFWREVKSLDLVDDYDLFKARSPTDFYSPSHEIITEDGYLNFSKHGIDNSYFTKILKENLDRKIETKINYRIVENPFIVPTALEYFREHWSSSQVWKSMKEKLGNDVWRYARRFRKKTDGVGISMVQRTLKDLHEPYYKTFFHQTRVYYSPLKSKATSFYIFLKLKKGADLPLFSELISKHCLMSVIYPPLKKEKKVMLFVLTSGEQLINIMRLISEFSDASAENKIILRDLNKTRYWTRYYLKMDYRLFNPDICSWEYNHKRYMEDLYNLVEEKEKRLVQIPDLRKLR